MQWPSESAGPLPFQSQDYTFLLLCICQSAPFHDCPPSPPPADLNFADRNAPPPPLVLSPSLTCRTHELFASLSEIDCAAMLSTTHLVQLGHNKELFRIGQKSSSLYFLLSGPCTLHPRLKSQCMRAAASMRTRVQAKSCVWTATELRQMF